MTQLAQDAAHALARLRVERTENFKLLRHAVLEESGNSQDLSDDAVAGFLQANLLSFTLKAEVVDPFVAGTLDVTVEHSDDEGVGDSWTTLVTFATVTSPTDRAVKVTMDAAAWKDTVRVKWVLAGGAATWKADVSAAATVSYSVADTNV